MFVARGSNHKNRLKSQEVSAYFINGRFGRFLEYW